MKKLSKMLWIISAIIILMLTVLTRRVESLPTDDEISLKEYEELDSNGHTSERGVCYYFWR